MDKMRHRTIYFTDLSLIPAFLLTVYTGVSLHLAVHQLVHEVWHNWAVAHTVASCLFLIMVVVHVKSHWGWYEGIPKRGIGKKSKVTFFLSLLFLTVSVTGLLLLVCIDGENSGVGLWHYRTGLLLIAIGGGHLIKRIPLLRRLAGKQEG